jgi:hypothetical protein
MATILGFILAKVSGSFESAITEPDTPKIKTKKNLALKCKNLLLLSPIRHLEFMVIIHIFWVLLPEIYFLGGILLP